MVKQHVATFEEVTEHLLRGAGDMLVLDCRPAPHFEACHILSSINAPHLHLYLECDRMVDLEKCFPGYMDRLLIKQVEFVPVFLMGSENQGEDLEQFRSLLCGMVTHSVVKIVDGSVEAFMEKYQWWTFHAKQDHKAPCRGSPPCKKHQSARRKTLSPRTGSGSCDASSSQSGAKVSPTTGSTPPSGDGEEHGGQKVMVLMEPLPESTSVLRESTVSLQKDGGASASSSSTLLKKSLVHEETAPPCGRDLLLVKPKALRRPHRHSLATFQASPRTPPPEGTDLEGLMLFERRLPSKKERLNTAHARIFNNLRQKISCDPPTQILPGLFLGSAQNAINRDELLELKIGSILNCARECTNFYPTCFQYMQKKWRDTEEQCILDGLSSCLDFIDQARQENSRVLVHCFVGISRSAAVVIAYLMRECSLTLAQSMQFVVSKRPIVKLNPFFVEQLGHYQELLATRTPISSPCSSPSTPLSGNNYFCSSSSPRHGHLHVHHPHSSSNLIPSPSPTSP